MPRIARSVASGFPHHVIQRGNNKEKVFFDKEDRGKYLSLLKKYSDKWDSPILAYCLMSNHVHLLTKPKNEDFSYSSARTHIAGARDEALGEKLFKKEQRKDYIKFIRSNIPGKEINSIRYYTRTGRPFGSEEFIKKMEKKLEREFMLKLPGRPRKQKER